MNRAPLTPQTEPVGPDGLTWRERTWLEQARRHTAGLNQLLSERGASARYAVGLAELSDASECTAGLLPRGSGPVDRCAVRGPHDDHRTAAGARWTDADSEVR